MGTTMTAPVQQTAPTKDEPKGIRGLLMHDPVREKVAPMLPPDVEYERVVAAAGLAVRQNPEILKCAPASIVDSVVRILQWGLELGVTAYLVPFKGKCTAVADYKGLAELMVASGAVRHVEARVVHAGDEFEYCFGLDAKLVHTPAVGADRGAITYAYVVLRLPFGRDAFDVMPIEEIDAIRQQYSKQWKGGPVPAWYAKKTVVRQASKLVPKNPRLRKALQVIQEDELAEFGDHLVPAADEPDALTPATTAAQLTRGAASATGSGMVSTPEYVDAALAEATPEVRAQAAEAMAKLEDPYEGERVEEISDAEIARMDAEQEQELALNDRRPSRRRTAQAEGR